MTGVKDGIGRHGQNLGPDTCHKCLMVAVREVGAAVAALKDYIACKDGFLLFIPEYHASG